MRTTVDFPAPIAHRIREIAHERGMSRSAIAVELTQRGLASLAEPPRVQPSQRSGFPTVRIGRTVTAAEIADFLDED
ncbi:MAG: hypothetical protein LBH13_00835 [Cellulomonadaceae bacterium]|nr:hypothetical protein [Cellulomonadaceae bacterium]